MVAALVPIVERSKGPSLVASRAPEVEAAAYVVMDGRTQQVLAGHRSERRLPVASLTKLMTARLVLLAGEPSHLVRVPAGRRARDESIIGLREGELQSREVLLRAVLIVSAGDGAHALAQDISGSDAAFVSRMNDEAARLKLRDTHYVNPVGLDADGQYSTALDTARLARVLMQDQAVRGAVVRRAAILHGRRVPATNTLLGRLDGIDGVKTGHTSAAGWCMAASASREGRRIYVVVLGAPSQVARDRAVATLMNWAFTRAAAGSQP